MFVLNDEGAAHSCAITRFTLCSARSVPSCVAAETLRMLKFLQFQVDIVDVDGDHVLERGRRLRALPQLHGYLPCRWCPARVPICNELLHVFAPPEFGTTNVHSP